MTSREGGRVPEVTFRTREEGQWRDVTTTDVFAGKRVVVLAVPGAFTPTCSSSHVPRYEERYEELRRRGVDDVVCISVNDAFVMDAWKREERAEHLRFLPDGNGEFTERMGLLVDKSDLGYGKRSWRYSMLVDDGVITKMFIEPNEPGDPYRVSDADTMLRFLNPDSPLPHDVLLFTTATCPHSARARRLLRARGMPFDEVRATPRRLSAIGHGERTPQVFVDGEYIGGATELERYLEKQEHRSAAE